MNWKLRKSIAEELIEAAVAEMGSGVKRMVGRSLPWATYNYLGGVLGGTAKGPNYATQGGMSVAEVKIDFAAISADRAAAGRAAVTNADILQILGIPTGILVLTVASTLDTAEGAAMTVDVGDGAGGQQYTAARNLNAAVGNRVVSSYNNVKFYAVDDNIILTVNNALPAKSVSHWFTLMADLRNTR